MHDVNFFSIIIPTYNRLSMLKRAVKSVAKQTFKDFELIIVNDGSQYQQEDLHDELKGLKIRFIKLEKNIGAAAARNIGIDHSNGHFIAFLDDDDEYEPRFLADSREAIIENNLDLCWSSASLKGPGNSREISHIDFENNFYSETHKYETLMSIGIGFGVCVKRQFLNSVGKFNTTYSMIEDAELFMRLAQAGVKLGAVNERNIIINDHQGDRLTATRNNEKRIAECRLLIEEYDDFLGQFPSLRRQLERQIHMLADSIPALEF